MASFFSQIGDKVSNLKNKAIQGVKNKFIRRQSKNEEDNKGEEPLTEEEKDDDWVRVPEAAEGETQMESVGGKRRRRKSGKRKKSRKKRKSRKRRKKTKRRRTKRRRTKRR